MNKRIADRTSELVEKIAKLNIPEFDDAERLVFETDHLSDKELEYATYSILVDLEDRLMGRTGTFKVLFDEYFRLVRKYNEPDS